ncbi:MAG TPA: hypothetical protein VGO55_14620 [Allosphingosinicella sp.]|nr:hypothetical protein [Allosphingosinicella sp.]
MSFYLKNPRSRVDYAIDWAATLDGQTIVSSLWSVAPVEIGGIAVDEDSFTPNRSAARLTGGIVGHCYSISNQVTLSDGTSDVRSITLRVEDK